MIRKDIIKKVIRAMVQAGYTGGASAEAVSWFAYAHGFKLNKNEVVYISYTF
jgi:hypothetical protein